MTLFSVLLISVALASDAFVAAITLGLTQKVHFKNAFKISGFFGVFQCKMAVFGWYSCLFFRHAIEPYDHYLAFFLLVSIGFNMMRQGQETKVSKAYSTSITSLTLVSLATSIDAFATGISLSIIDSPIYMPSLIIGTITFILCFVGVYLGKKLRKFISQDSKLYFLSGAILIAMGIKLLIEHSYYA